MNLLKLELIAEETHQHFGARVDVTECGVVLRVNPPQGAVFAPRYVRQIAEALERGAKMVEGR
jgi:hypothetical protein